MKIKLRPIVESDFENLISMFNEFALFEKTPENMVNTLEQMKLEKEYVKGFIAMDENKVVCGYVTYFISYHTWVGKSMYMDDLYVRENYRSAGIGTQLINQVISLAKTEKCSRLRWQVSDWNQPAIDFYKSLGATINSVESNCSLVL